MMILPFPLDRTFQHVTDATPEEAGGGAPDSSDPAPSPMDRLRQELALAVEIRSARLPLQPIGELQEQ